MDSEYIESEAERICDEAVVLIEGAGDAIDKYGVARSVVVCLTHMASKRLEEYVQSIMDCASEDTLSDDRENLLSVKLAGDKLIALCNGELRDNAEARTAELEAEKIATMPPAERRRYQAQKAADKHLQDILLGRDSAGQKASDA